MKRDVLLRVSKLNRDVFLCGIFTSLSDNIIDGIVKTTFGSLSRVDILFE